jgi:D-alanyl-D-alanine carboxypeptidase
MLMKKIVTISLFFLLFQNCKKTEEPIVILPIGQIVQKDIPLIDNSVTALMQKYNLPGVTLAISKAGKMVYVKGYGLADKEKNEKVTIESRFRVGSMSKTLCAVAILKLIQDGKLKLDDKVFGDGAVLGTLYGKKTYSADLKNITVKNLLNHTAGAWGTLDNQGDIMGQVVTASNGDFFSHILDNYPLVSKPGTRYSYANFGYFILARIIDKVTGKPYVDYLNDDVLKDLGLKNKVELTGATEAERKVKEVKYYGQTTAETASIYNLNLNRRDGSGGMLLTASDYLRFVNAVDGFTIRPDILNAPSLITFTTPSGNPITSGTTTPSLLDPYYACGLQVISEGTWTHTGSINCQYGQWFRHPLGINVVMITNGRPDPANATLFNQFMVDFQTSTSISFRNFTQIDFQSIDQF